MADPFGGSTRNTFIYPSVQHDSNLSDTHHERNGPRAGHGDDDQLSRCKSARNHIAKVHLQKRISLYICSLGCCHVHYFRIHFLLDLINNRSYIWRESQLPKTMEV